MFKKKIKIRLFLVKIPIFGQKHLFLVKSTYFWSNTYFPAFFSFFRDSGVFGALLGLF